MTDDQSTHVEVSCGHASLIEMLAVLLESEGFVVSTRHGANANSDSLLLVPEHSAETVRSFISKWHRRSESANLE